MTYNVFGGTLNVTLSLLSSLVFTDGGVEQKGIPDFWLKILKNMDIVDPMIRVCPRSLYSAYLCKPGWFSLTKTKTKLV